MTRKLILVLLLFCSLQLVAQTGIGTTTPNASAKLDVYSTNKGFLPPRVILTSATDASTIASPAEGLLVYNLGSVGLQAGYYYWNGANWATIATATSAGNGVTAMDMVKLYGEAHSSAAGKISSSTGYVFTVPVSGRYLFDFTSSGTALSGGTTTFYFQVRQGTTVLGTDMQSSYNNNVHVEYNGKVEVNLQAGVSYNVYNYTTSGSFEVNDYDRVYYKMVAGNLPVTGQTVDYVSVTRSGSDQTVNSGDVIVFNTIDGGNIPYNTSTGLFMLTAGKTYKLIAGVSLSNGNGSAKEVNINWKNAAGNILGSKGELLSPSANVTAAGGGIAYAVYTPLTNTTVGLYVNYSSASTLLWQNFTFASIEQIGSSAIINPWTLSGTNTYNTTGNVGIGTSTLASTLTVGKADGTTSGEITLNPQGTSNEGGQLTIKKSLSGGANDWTIDHYATSNSDSRFRIFNGATETNGISLKESGNLGIGNTTPTDKLVIGSSVSIHDGGDKVIGLGWSPGSSNAIFAGKPAEIRLATSSGTLSFGTDPTTRTVGATTSVQKRMSITSDGKVGIGTDAPNAKLNVLTSDGNSVYIQSNTTDNNGMLILNANTDQNWGYNWHEFIYFQKQGNSIGNITSASNGSAISYNTTSDYRLKTDLKNYNGLDLINRIKTYDYAWKSNNSRMYGVMAHELQLVIPYMVTGEKDAIDAQGKIIPQSVDYSKLTPLLVKAVQEQDVIIKEQQKQIDNLIKRIDLLERKN